VFSWCWSCFFLEFAQNKTGNLLVSYSPSKNNHVNIAPYIQKQVGSKKKKGKKKGKPKHKKKICLLCTATTAAKASQPGATEAHTVGASIGTLTVKNRARKPLIFRSSVCFLPHSLALLLFFFSRFFFCFRSKRSPQRSMGHIEISGCISPLVQKVQKRQKEKKDGGEETMSLSERELN